MADFVLTNESQTSGASELLSVLTFFSVDALFDVS